MTSSAGSVSARRLARNVPKYSKSLRPRPACWRRSLPAYRLRMNRSVLELDEEVEVFDWRTHCPQEGLAGQWNTEFLCKVDFSVRDERIDEFGSNARTEPSRRATCFGRRSGRAAVATSCARCRRSPAGSERRRCRNSHRARLSGDGRMAIDRNDVRHAYRCTTPSMRSARTFFALS